MASGISWLPIFTALAGPIVIAVAYARQAKRSAPAVTKAFVQAQQRIPKYVARTRLRWYHVIASTAALTLPFIQWFAYLKYGTRLSFLLPLFVTATLMLVVGMLRPRFVLIGPPNPREAGLRAAILAAALIIALALPPSGTLTVLRGALSDILALSIVGFLARVWNTPKTKAEIGA